MARARTLWEEGTEPGRKVVTLGVTATLTVVVLDLLLRSSVTVLFDLGFVLVCVAAALLVRPVDFFTVGVYPPLLMLGVFALLALVDPTTIAHRDDGLVQAVVTGLAGHSGALISGYALCLGCLAIRRSVGRPDRDGRVRAQASNRSGSPAPRRTTSGAPAE